MKFLWIFSVFCLVSSSAFSQEYESIEIKGNACEKSIEGESPSSTRIRAIDKAVFLSIKNLDILSEDKKKLNDHDLNVMIYRLVDDYVEDLSSKVVKSDENKTCVETLGYIQLSNINNVRQEALKTPEIHDDNLLVQIVEDVSKEVTLNPKDAENLALLYVSDLEYYNGSKSKKYADFLKEEIKENPYYYITDEKDLADYIMTPKLLKAKVDSLDATHKRLHMVLSLDVDGLEENVVNIFQNRFILFSNEDSEQSIASRLIKKLIIQASKSAVRQIERKEQIKLERRSLGRQLTE